MKYPATIKNNESTSCKKLKESVTYFKENSKTKKIAMCMVYVKNKIMHIQRVYLGLPWQLSSKAPPAYRRHGFHPWVWRIPWRRAWQPTPAFLPGKSHGQRSLAGYSPWGHKESDTTEATSHTCMQTAYLGKNRQKNSNSRSLLNRPGTEVGGKYAFNYILSRSLKFGPCRHTTSNRNFKIKLKKYCICE